MKVYHGSPLLVTSPDTRHCRNKAEFGQGFYVTPFLEQAIWWSGSFEHPRMAEYEFDTDAASQLCWLRFESESPEFRLFTARCLEGVPHEYDIVSGPLIESEVPSEYNYTGQRIQICFATQRAIDRCLKYIRELPLKQD